jgi:hypothetical protein
LSCKVGGIKDRRKGRFKGGKHTIPKKTATRTPSPKKPRAKQSDDNDGDYKVSFAFFG